jgi:SAM-dependent methyltransferase
MIQKFFNIEVYAKARELIKKEGLRNVLDIGCGVGMKLRELIYPVCKDITRLDKPNTIEQCKKLHNFGQWYAVNIEYDELEELSEPLLGKDFDLIISSDIIEHLVNPNRLIYLIKKLSNDNTLILLSTIDRDIARGVNDKGPPPNIGHCREWNFSEFRNYIEALKFQIIEHVRCRSMRLSAFSKFKHYIKIKIFQGLGGNGGIQYMLLKRGI